MVVVMRQADQRHALGKPELPGENFWRPRHLVEAAAVEAGSLGGAQQLQLCGISSITERAIVPASVG